MSEFDRDRALARIADEHFDILVIGGGITGAGIALDAAARGLCTALVERGDFASGTSSKSSKLVHGGLRYLQQREFGLVYEALAERQRLLRNAPHLVQVLPFLIPLFGRDGVVNRSVAKAMSSALWMYDLTGGARLGKLHERVSIEEARAHMPTLRTDRLVAGWIYYDAQADDARLTLAITRTAVLDHGAVAANYAPVVALLTDDSGRVIGARLHDGLDVYADAVVNATGVWADAVAGLEGAGAGGAPQIRPAKGIHLAVPWSKVRNDIAVVMPVPGDRRSIFVVPWSDRVYIGTTDTDYDGPLDDPQCTVDDVAYLLKAINAAIDEPIEPSDVLGTWAGLRPLVATATSSRTADLSRRHRVGRSSGGLVSVTGGKLTTYRKMAADTVDVVVGQLGRGARRSPTRRLRLRGAAGYDTFSQAGAGQRFGVADGLMEHLAKRYGGEARTLLAIVQRDRSLASPLVAGLPYLRAEAVYAARYEMAQTLDDILSRRTRARILGRDASAAAAHDVALVVGAELGWTDDQIAAEVRRYRESVAAERAAAELPEVVTALS
jgi:glycerol-3-phosphate dehydrogenase